jgi:hypothetical protein
MAICENCKRECIKHAKGMCTTCYKKLHWKPKPHECKRCERTLPHHAKGLCAGCYNTVFHLDSIKDYRNQKYHNIPIELYKKRTKKCFICGFDKVVELHHLDKNHKNNSEGNLIGLCPNHHKMIHLIKYNAEMRNKIEEKLDAQKNQE